MQCKTFQKPPTVVLRALEEGVSFVSISIHEKKLFSCIKVEELLLPKDFIKSEKRFKKKKTILKVCACSLYNF